MDQYNIETRILAAGILRGDQDAIKDIIEDMMECDLQWLTIDSLVRWLEDNFEYYQRFIA